MLYEIRWTRQAEKDYEHIKAAGLAPKVAEIMKTVRQNPFEPSQGFKKLKGRKDTYSRQITKKHRFTYTVLPNTQHISDAEEHLRTLARRRRQHPIRSGFFRCFLMTPAVTGFSAQMTVKMGGGRGMSRLRALSGTAIPLTMSKEYGLDSV